MRKMHKLLLLDLLDDLLMYFVIFVVLVLVCTGTGHCQTALSSRLSALSSRLSALSSRLSVIRLLGCYYSNHSFGYRLLH